MGADEQYMMSADGLRIAYRFLPGKGPTLVFLPGYMSDMEGSKAVAVFDWSAANGRSCLLLDYAGCGESEGDFSDGDFGVWARDALELIDALTFGQVILIGSSMGGWLMLILGEVLGKRLAGMIGIAAAPDFSDWGFSADQKREILERGVVYEDSPYGPEPTPTWKRFYLSAQSREMLGREIAIDCPVRLLHGQADSDVPWEISIKLAAALRSSDVQLQLVKDADHRFSRQEDIALLLRSVEGIL
jgi:pimeloyl-ACP methyl ester carboxylesterase